MMEKIAKLLKDTREDLDLSQLDVMKQTGINNKALSRYENNATEPDLGTLAVLFRLYHLSLDSALDLCPECTESEEMTVKERNLLKQFRALPPDIQKFICTEVEALFRCTTENK